MLPPRTRFRLLTQQTRQGMADAIERCHRRQAHHPAARLQRLADLRVDQREQDDPRIVGDLLQDALEVRLAAHHRPEVPERLDPVELRQRRLGDVLKRLARRVRQEVQVQPHGSAGQGCGQHGDKR